MGDHGESGSSPTLKNIKSDYGYMYTVYVRSAASIYDYELKNRGDVYSDK